MPTFFRRLRARLKYWNHERDLKREIEAHREMAAGAWVDSGHDDDEARVRAARQLGNTTLAREASRAVWVARWWEATSQDVRYALRGLRHAPGFALAAIFTLTAGLALNTSVFTAINAVLVRPWQLPNADRVVSVFLGRGSGAVTYGGMSVAELRYLAAESRTADIVGMRDEQVEFDASPGDRRPVRVATGNYFSTLGVPVQVGRGFEPAEDLTDAPRAVVVLGDRTWRELYGGRADLVGTAIKINGVPFLVVGIAAPNAKDTPLDPPAAAWLPFAATALLGGNESVDRHFLTDPATCCSDVAGRLVPGATRQAAQEELAGLSQRFHADHNIPSRGIMVSGTALGDGPRAGTATPIFSLITAGTLLVLLLACANVGNLLLARALARRTEMRVRLALGASRGRVIRQLMTESLLVAGIAGLLSLPIAGWLPTQLFAAIDPRIAQALDMRIDMNVWLFTLAVVIFAAVSFALMPAIRATRAAARLNAGARGGADRAGVRLRMALLCGQVAIGVVLLITAGLLTRAVTRAGQIDPGFRLDDVTVATVSLPPLAYSAERKAALAASIAAMTVADGSPLAAFAEREPLAQGNAIRQVRLPGEDAAANRTVEWQSVAPGYFAVMGIPMLSGRTPPTGSQSEVVVNETMARLLWQTTDALGRVFVGGNGAPMTVVGVAQDARLSEVDEQAPIGFAMAGVNERPSGAALPMTFVVRRTHAPDFERALTAIDARIRVVTKPVADNLDTMLRPSKLGASMAAAMGLLAIVIAGIGVSGVFSYLVTARRREVGVRLALGANRRSIVRVVLGSAGWALLGGALAGVLIAAALSPALQIYLYGLSPFDPVAFARALGLLAALAILATIGPIVRATRVDPAVTLRQY